MVIDTATRLVEQEGPAGLTTRRIAGEIGYSPGTLYNLFADLDEIVLHLNMATLDRLQAQLDPATLDSDVRTALIELAERYVSFVATHPRLWALVFHRYSPDRRLPDEYRDRLDRLFGLAEHILVRRGSAAGGDARDTVRILWSGLHGMCSLAADGIMMNWDDVRRLSRVMIDNHLAGTRWRG